MQRIAASAASLPLVIAGLAPAAVAAPIGAGPPPPAAARRQVAAVPAAGLSPVTKMLVVIEENHSIGPAEAGMPYLMGLAHRYGYATDYWAVSHPSLPNYLDLAAGSTFGITDDGPPSAHPITAQSVFGLAVADHRSAAIYAESMPVNCDTTDASPYWVHHNPWAYFVNERGSCQAHDVSTAALAADAAAGTLPIVGMVVPNANNDAHDGTLAQADAWLQAHLPAVLAGPDFTSGRLAVEVVFDEGTDTQNVLAVVAQAGLSHAVVTAPLTHASTHASLVSLASGAAPGGLLAAFGLGAGGYATAAGPAAAATTEGLHLVTRTAGGAVAERTRTGSGGWGGAVGLGGHLIGSPAAGGSGGTLDVAAAGTDRAVWLRPVPDRGTAGAWTWLGGHATSSPAIAVVGAGSATVAVRGADGAVWLRGATAGRWGRWGWLGGRLRGAPAVAGVGSDLVVVGVGQDRAVWARSAVAGRWSAWTRLGGVATADPGLGIGPSGRLLLAVRGTTGATYLRTAAADGTGWSAWSDLGGRTVAAPAATGWGSASEVFVIGTDGAVYQDSSTGSRWSGWQRVP